MLDKSALMGLLRLIFVPEQLNKALTFKLLSNIAENSKSRADVIILLLTILSEGSVDLAAVDALFLQISSRQKSKLAATPKKAVATSTPSV